jgi:hypothetical protein
MSKRTILIQLDTDNQPSVFDRVVAVDAGADEIFAYGNVSPGQVQTLVHGAIFTRGPADLRYTAIFIGGSDVARGEALMVEAQKHMIPDFGLRVSVMLDANGCNTTASAAVRSVEKHVSGKGNRALVLGGTGPVGQRAGLLLARGGFEVLLASRSAERSEAAANSVRKLAVEGSLVKGIAPTNSDELKKSLEGVQVVVAAGAAGVCLLGQGVWSSCPDLRVLVDLNAVPPLGIEGVEVMDKGTERHGKIVYGALGVGGLKMKLHRKAVQSLFESNKAVLDAVAIHQIELA